MPETLLEPSLRADSPELTKSYDLEKFFWVAFLGGVFPTMVLAVKSARWLKVEKWLVNVMIALGTLAFVAEVVIIGLMFNGTIPMRSRAVRLLVRGAALALYLVYVRILKQKYLQHVLTQGELIPVVKDAVIWSLVAVPLELGGGALIAYAF